MFYSVTQMKYTLLIALALLVFSCKTAQQRAYNHVRKAVALDPSILKVPEPITLIDTVWYQLPNIEAKDSSMARIDTVYIVEEIKEGAGITTAQSKKAVEIALLNFNKTLEKDTASVDTFNISAIAYYKHDQLFLELNQTDTTLKQTVETTFNCPPIVKVEPVVKKWYQNMWLWVSVGLMALIVLFAFRR